MLDRLLIVGLGSIGRRHLRIARELLPHATVGALRRAGRSEPAPGGGDGADATFTRVEDAVAFAPQAAVIANPAPQHLAAALPLATAGAHLLVEKPIAHESAGVAALIAECARRRLVLMTGYNLRFLSSMRRFRDLVRDGRVGRVLSVRAEVGQYLPSWRPDSDYRQSVSARSELGGGALLELSHELDYLRWIFGDVSWVHATTQGVSDLEIDVEDVAYLTIGFGGPGGAKWPVAMLAMDFVRHDTTRQCTVVGDKGTLRWDAIAGTVTVFDADSKGWQTLVDSPGARDESYRKEWREFLRCVKSGAAADPSGGDGLAVLRIVEAARASARSGVVTRVESH